MYMYIHISPHSDFITFVHWVCVNICTCTCTCMPYTLHTMCYRNTPTHTHGWCLKSKHTTPITTQSSQCGTWTSHWAPSAASHVLWDWHAQCHMHCGLLFPDKKYSGLDVCLAVSIHLQEAPTCRYIHVYVVVWYNHHWKSVLSTPTYLTHKNSYTTPLLPSHCSQIRGGWGLGWCRRRERWLGHSRVSQREHPVSPQMEVQRRQSAQEIWPRSGESSSKYRTESPDPSYYHAPPQVLPSHQNFIRKETVEQCGVEVVRMGWNSNNTCYNSNDCSSDRLVQYTWYRSLQAPPI